jgi:thiosulfate/3-mercaptopyruvate sulfurtransferase
MTFTTLIGAAALRDLVGKPGIAVIDCRFDLMNSGGGRRAFLEGHIPGARYADLNRDLSAPVTATSGRHPLPSPAVFAGTLARLRVGRATQVIAYDDSAGAFAARLWWMLRWMGHPAAAVLDGGIQAWVSAGGALESGEEEPLPAAEVGDLSAPASAGADATAVIGTAELEQRLSDPAFLLIDARAAERFAGTVEPIDAIAGHVAGAVNQPFSANLGADGRFLPAPVLRQAWEKRLAGRSPTQLAVMCGSGVTACHNLLSLEVAGLRGAKLYAGSWSEWIRDPRRPIARGA